MSRFLSILAVCAVWLGGCDAIVRPSVPQPPDGIAVYSTVRAHDSTQYAVVSRPRAADENQIRYVQNADVAIGGHELRVVPAESLTPGVFDPLTPPGETIANYRTDSLRIRPGGRYSIRVITDSHRVTGSVHVPGRFTAVVDSMMIRWTQSPGARTYHVRLRRYRSDDNDLAWEYRATTEDTSIVVPEVADRGGEFVPGVHHVLVTAVDSNLVSYRRPESRRAGIHGGYGFFGATTRIGGFVTIPARSDGSGGSNGGSVDEGRNGTLRSYEAFGRSRR